MGFKEFFKGKNNKREEDSGIRSFANSMIESSDLLMKKRIINPVTIKFIKMSVEFDLLISKNELDEVLILQRKLEEFLKFAQTFKSGDNIKGKDVIIFYENIPNLLEKAKIAINEKERIYKDMKNSAKSMFEILDKIEKDLIEMKKEE